MKRRMLSRLLLVFVIAGLASVAGAEIAKPKIFNIKSYGAIGDGVLYKYLIIISSFEI